MQEDNESTAPIEILPTVNKTPAILNMERALGITCTDMVTRGAQETVLFEGKPLQAEEDSEMYDQNEDPYIFIQCANKALKLVRNFQWPTTYPCLQSQCTLDKMRTEKLKPLKEEAEAFRVWKTKWCHKHRMEPAFSKNETTESLDLILKLCLSWLSKKRNHTLQDLLDHIEPLNYATIITTLAMGIAATSTENAEGATIDIEPPDVTPPPLHLPPSDTFGLSQASIQELDAAFPRIELDSQNTIVDPMYLPIILKALGQTNAAITAIWHQIVNEEIKKDEICEIQKLYLCFLYVTYASPGQLPYIWECSHEGTTEPHNDFLLKNLLEISKSQKEDQTRDPIEIDILDTTSWEEKYRFQCQEIRDAQRESTFPMKTSEQWISDLERHPNQHLWEHQEQFEAWHQQWEMTQGNRSNSTDHDSEMQKKSIRCIIQQTLKNREPGTLTWEQIATVFLSLSYDEILSFYTKEKIQQINYSKTWLDTGEMSIQLPWHAKGQQHKEEQLNSHANSWIFKDDRVSTPDLLVELLEYMEEFPIESSFDANKAWDLLQAEPNKLEMIATWQKHILIIQGRPSPLDNAIFSEARGEAL